MPPARKQTTQARQAGAQGEPLWGPPSAKRRDFAISHVLLEIEGLVFFSEYDVQ